MELPEVFKYAVLSIAYQNDICGNIKQILIDSKLEEVSIRDAIDVLINIDKTLTIACDSGRSEINPFVAKTVLTQISGIVTAKLFNNPDISKAQQK